MVSFINCSNLPKPYSLTRAYLQGTTGSTKYIEEQHDGIA